MTTQDPAAGLHGVAVVDKYGPECICGKDFPFNSGGWLAFNEHIAALDEAWRAAQQAAPAGWWIGVERDHHGMYRGTAWEMGSRVGTIVGTIGSFGTEAGAIRALAARLAKESGGVEVIVGIEESASYVEDMFPDEVEYLTRALTAAAQNISDRRTLLDDGFWVSRKEMRALDLALGRDDIGVPENPAGLREVRKMATKEDGSPLEWSGLSDALDATDDVMLQRGHRLSSYSNEEYAAELRKHLAATEPGLCRCGRAKTRSAHIRDTGSGTP